MVDGTVMVDINMRIKTTLEIPNNMLTRDQANMFRDQVFAIYSIDVSLPAPSAINYRGHNIAIQQNGRTEIAIVGTFAESFGEIIYEQKRFGLGIADLLHYLRNSMCLSLSDDEFEKLMSVAIQDLMLNYVKDVVIINKEICLRVLYNGELEPQEVDNLKCARDIYSIIGWVNHNRAKWPKNSEIEMKNKTPGELQL